MLAWKTSKEKEVHSFMVCRRADGAPITADVIFNCGSLIRREALPLKQAIAVCNGLQPHRPMLVGYAGVRASVGLALGHGRRGGLRLAVEAERGRRIEEAIVQDADEQRLRHVCQHGADACRIGDVARQRIELVDGLLQFTANAGGSRPHQYLAGAMALEIGQHVVELAEGTLALDLVAESGSA